MAIMAFSGAPSGPSFHETSKFVGCEPKTGVTHMLQGLSSPVRLN